jgi:hypothetical protein
MRRANLAVVALSAMLGGASALAADSGPVIVIPGKLGMPVIINGVDVSGAVLEGDWGLYKPHMVGPTIISGPALSPERNYQGGYYPAFGRSPGYGRFEIEPPADRRLPPPAQSYHRSWSSQSDPLPASLDPPVQSPPLIVSPQIWPRRRHGGDAPPARP